MIVKHPSLQWACLSVTGSVKISLLQLFFTRKKRKQTNVLFLCHRIASCSCWSARNVVSNCPTYSGLSLQTLPLYLGKSALHLKICVMTFILLNSPSVVCSQSSGLHCFHTSSMRGQPVYLKCVYIVCLSFTSKPFCLYTERNIWRTVSRSSIILHSVSQNS